MADNQRQTNKTDRELGAFLRAERLERRMSQETLAEVLGITFQQVQKYEKGINRVAVSRFFDIADAFGIYPDALITRFIGWRKPRTGRR